MVHRRLPVQQRRHPLRLSRHNCMATGSSLPTGMRPWALVHASPPPLLALVLVCCCPVLPSRTLIRCVSVPPTRPRPPPKRSLLSPTAPIVSRPPSTTCSSVVERCACKTSIRSSDQTNSHDSSSSASPRHTGPATICSFAQRTPSADVARRRERALHASFL